ncbi:MAG: questin oxidase family protein, partial [Thermoanaerobaculia bacterium]|nr:questin oxidase family protein [Thermoanaerobaculia bacterium]
MTRISRRRLLHGAAAAAAAGLGVRNAASSSPRGSQAIEDALALLAETGPEYHGGLANHGPMAAEALVALERFDAVVPWVTRYRPRLDAHPTGSRLIREDWREALGARNRVADWSVFFGREVKERPWRDAIATWVPRLSPGMIAAAFHGVIRTAHAARSLAAEETPARRRELGEGLAYWAANYRPLPEARTGARGRRRPSQALADVPGVPAADQIARGNIVDRLAPVERFAPFVSAADLVDTTGDASAFLSDLTETFAGVFLASVPPGSLITFIHGVTGPSAVRLLLPHLDPAARAAALRYAWQGAAAMYSGFSGKAPSVPRGEAPARADLVDRAIATGDEHAIKLTEACLREH